MADLGSFVSYDLGVTAEYQFLQSSSIKDTTSFGYKPYYVTGTVLDKNGIPAARKVISIKESNDSIVSIVESDPVTGEYIARMESMEPHTLVFTGESGRNAIVYSGVIPNE